MNDYLIVHVNKVVLIRVGLLLLALLGMWGSYKYGYQRAVNEVFEYLQRAANNNTVS